MERAENINPRILAWARESAGLSLEDAAARVGLASTGAASAVEKLEELERGAKFPTRNQLSKIASVYRRPLITFYMHQPPQLTPRGADFRNVSAAVSHRENAMLDALLRDIRARQEMVKAILEDEGATPLDFVASATMQRGVQFVVESIANWLEFPVNNPRRNGTAEDLFKDLRRRAERIGIFVILAGDLGHHTQAVSERVFRGFVIADPIAPFVVVNDQDARTARSFTLVHELAHLWLGQTGVSGSPSDLQPATSQGQVELFCNDVAGYFLLPDQALASIGEFPADNIVEAAQMISRLADMWRVSEAMVAYRMSRANRINISVLRELWDRYARRWQALKAKEKEKAKESDSGPNPHVVKQFKLGDALMGVVHGALRNNQLTHTKAAKLLGVKPTSVESLIRRYESGRGALTFSSSN